MELPRRRRRKILVRFLIVAAIFGACATAEALSVPAAPMGRVHDQAGLLTPEQSRALESELASFEGETSNQIVVATFPSLEGGSLEDFSIHLMEAWKIGQKGKDNGILLLIVPAERLVRIEVGYGLEGVVSDATSSRIIEERLSPAFRRGDYHGGVRSAVQALQAATRGSYDPERKSAVPRATLPSGFVIFIVLVFLFLSFRRRRRGLFGGRGGWTLGGPSFGGGFFGGGRSSGGFSGGGGSFGGGGASGRW